MRDAGLSRAVTRADLLRFRLASFQRKIDRARAVIAEALQTATPWWVAFSGGKDSLVTLALVREQQPDIAVVWGDDELEYPETPEYITGLARTWGLHLTVAYGTWGWVRGGRANHAGWFYPWSEHPFWREPVTGAVWLDTETRHWMPAQGYGGVFLGLRAEERFHRRVHLRASGLLQRTQIDWHCNPIGWWSTDEVWALIAGWDLPYHPAYDRMTVIGVPRAQQRVGPLPLSSGWMLRLGWPELYRRLIARYGQRWGG